MRKRKEQYVSDIFVFKDGTCTWWIAHGHFAKVQSFGCHVLVPSTWYLVTLGTDHKATWYTFRMLLAPGTALEQS